MTTYAPKAQEKVRWALQAFEEGTLRNSSGKIVTDRRQAIAVGLSKARNTGKIIARD